MNPKTLRQISGILRLELRSCLFGRRALATYFLAFAPVGLTFLVALMAAKFGDSLSINEVQGQFAWAYDKYLRTALFLACLILFMSLFRSEVMRKSLHYYFLTPVRREVLVAGKYVSALASSVIVFAVATALLYLCWFLPLGSGNLSQHFFHGNGIVDLLTYVWISVLACAGYGSVFLLAGLFLRNPVVAAVALWAWEAINFILPALLKKVSVIFYLTSLYPPYGSNDRLFSIEATPVSPWLSVPGLVLFTAAVLAVAGFRARGMEINYGDD